MTRAQIDEQVRLAHHGACLEHRLVAELGEVCILAGQDPDEVVDLALQTLPGWPR